MSAHQVPHYTIRAGRPLTDGGFAQAHRTTRPTRPAAMAVAASLPDDMNHELVEVTEYLGYDHAAGVHVIHVIARRIAGAWVTDLALTA